jgi:hypothetical protein
VVDDVRREGNPQGRPDAPRRRASVPTTPAGRARWRRARSPELIGLVCETAVELDRRGGSGPYGAEYALRQVDDQHLCGETDRPHRVVDQGRQIPHPSPDERDRQQWPGPEPTPCRPVRTVSLEHPLGHDIEMADSSCGDSDEQDREQAVRTSSFGSDTMPARNEPDEGVRRRHSGYPMREPVRSSGAL